MAPHENLVIEGVPSVPAEIATRASRYTNFRAALFTTWNPTRREMLIATRFGDTFQIHKVAAPGAARTQLTFYSDSVRSAFYPPKVAAGTGDSFVFSKDIGGGEYYQLYRYDVATGAVTLLTDGKSRNTDEIWSHDGAKLAYGSTKRNGNDVDIWITDPWHPETAKLVVQNAGGGWGPADFSPDGSQLLLTEYVSANESNLYVANLTTGEKTQITPPQLGGKDAASISQKIAYGGAAFTRDGKGVYLTTDKDSEFQRLAYFDLGRIYADQNRNQEAIAAFERAVKLDPSQPDAHYRLARLYTLVGQKQKAAEEFAKTKELHSKTEDSLIQKVSGDAAPAPQQ